MKNHRVWSQEYVFPPQLQIENTDMLNFTIKALKYPCVIKMIREHK